MNFSKETSVISTLNVIFTLGKALMLSWLFFEISFGLWPESSRILSKPKALGVFLSLEGIHFIFGIIPENPFKINLLWEATLLPSFAVHPICLENSEHIKEDLVVVYISSSFPVGWDFYKCLSTTTTKDLSSVVKIVIHNFYFEVELLDLLKCFFFFSFDPIGLMF